MANAAAGVVLDEGVCVLNADRVQQLPSVAQALRLECQNIVLDNANREEKNAQKLNAGWLSHRLVLMKAHVSGFGKVKSTKTEQGGSRLTMSSINTDQ